MKFNKDVVKRMARKHNVSVRTVRKYLTEAVRRGFLSEAGLTEKAKTILNRQSVSESS